MSYNWNINKMEKELKTIKSFLEKVKEHGGKIKDLEFNYKQLNEAVYNYYFHRDINTVDKSRFLDKNEYLTENNYKDYYKTPDVIRKDLLNSFKLFKDLDDNYNEIELRSFRCSNDDLVSLVYDYVNWLPTKNKIWKESFYKFINPNNQQLKFRKYNGLETYYGMTYFITYPYYKPYFLINRRYTIADFFTLIHELSHGTVGMFGDGKSPYIGEIEGWFSHYLGREFLKENKIIRSKQLTQLEYDDFDIIYDFYLSLIMYHCYAKLRRQKKGIDVNVIKRRTSRDLKYFSLNDELLRYYLSIRPSTFATYIYSYLLSLDLEEQYKIDPEISFYNFDRFVNSNSVIDHNNLRTYGFTFMDDNFKSLQKKIDKINSL